MLLPSGLERSLQERALIAKREKEAIAEIASAQVRDGDTLILDAGRVTTGALARQLRRFRNLKVITNGFSVMLALAEAEIYRKSSCLAGPSATSATGWLARTPNQSSGGSTN